MRYLDEEWGIDILGKAGTQKALNGGIDPWFFYDKNEEKEIKALFEVTEDHLELGVLPLKIVE